MKLFALAASACLAAVSMFAAAAPAPLTNTDVIQLVRNGASVEDVRSKICSSQPAFLLQNFNLLTTMGVPATLLETMELRQSTGSCEPRPVAAYTPPASKVKSENAELEKLQVPGSKKRRIFAPWAKRK